MTEQINHIGIGRNVQREMMGKGRVQKVTGR